MKKINAKQVKIWCIAWAMLAATIICIGVIRHFNSRKLLYWKGEKYSFDGDYVAELPQDAQYLGKAQYKKYKDSLGEDLTCNLAQLSPDAQQMINDSSSGDVFYSQSKGAILIAIYTDLNNDKSRKYFVFFP